MKRPLILLLTCVLCGCATYYGASAPTQLMVDDQLLKPKKLVPFVSRLSIESIEQGLLSSDCGRETTTISSVTSVPSAGMVGTWSTYRFTVESGGWPNGARWVALRVDGLFHGAPAGVKLESRPDGGTDVTAFAADSRKIAAMRERIEDGSYFCHWREFSYPYD